MYRCSSKTTGRLPGKTKRLNIKRGEGKRIGKSEPLMLIWGSSEGGIDPREHYLG